MTFQRRKRGGVPEHLRQSLDGKCCRLHKFCQRCKTEFVDDSQICDRCGNHRFCTRKIGVNGYDNVTDLLGLPCVHHGGPKDPDSITSMLTAKIMPRSIEEISRVRKQDASALSLEQNIAIGEARLYQLIDRIGTNNNSQSWDLLESAVFKLKKALRGMQENRPDAYSEDAASIKRQEKYREFQRMQAEAIQEIISIVDDPSHAEKLWDEINLWNTKVADLKAKENRIIVERKLAMTPVETMAFLGQLKEMMGVAIMVGLENLRRAGHLTIDADHASSVLMDTIENKIVAVIDQTESAS